MKHEAGVRAFPLTVTTWSHKSWHTQAHFPSRQLIPPIIPWLEYACHHRDKQQSHRGIVGYLSPPIYRQPVTPDGWESGFICLSPSLLDSLFAFYLVSFFLSLLALRVAASLSIYLFNGPELDLKSSMAAQATHTNEVVLLISDVRCCSRGRQSVSLCYVTRVELLTLKEFH